MVLLAGCKIPQGMGLVPLFQAEERKGEGEGAALRSLLSSPNLAWWVDGMLDPALVSLPEITAFSLLMLPPGPKLTSKAEMQTAARLLALTDTGMHWGLQESS